MDTAETIVILAVGAGITIVVAGVIGLFYAGRGISWLWRRR